MYTGNLTSELMDIVQRNLGNDPLAAWCRNIQKFMDELPDLRCAGHILAGIGGYHRKPCQELAVVSILPQEAEERYGEGERFSLCRFCWTHYKLGYFEPMEPR